MLKKVLLFLPLYVIWVGIAGYSIFGLCQACLGPGPLQLLSIGGYLVLILIPIWPLIHWMTASPGWMKKVEANGLSAPAVILSVQDTGLVINNTLAVVKLRLRVEPPNAAPFEASQEQRISLITGLGRYAAGAQVTVKYDPGHPQHVVILSVPDSPPAAPARAAAAAPSVTADVAQQLAELSKLHRSGELSASEFAAAKKKLLG